MELDLAGKVVCVTGGSSGIGYATALAFAAEGARVVICARNADKLAQAAQRIEAACGVAVETLAMDVTDVADIGRLADYLQQRHGRLDVLVNNAGTGTYKAFDSVTDDELRYGMEINFFAQFRITQRTLPLLKRATRPVVLNISGRTALRGNFPPGSSCTGPAKAAEVRFSIDLATELAEHGIRVNCVVPGVVKSDERFKMWEGQAFDRTLDAQQADAVRIALEQQSVPAGQSWGTPEEVANVIVFLASDRAAYVNGVALTVDGGPHTKSYVTQLYTAAPAAS